MYKTLVQQFDEAFGLAKPKMSFKQKLIKKIHNSHIYYKFKMREVREKPYKDNFETYL